MTMCQLFGFSGKKYEDITDRLEQFYQHSKSNPHGWGLACWEKPDRFIAREPIQASYSRYLRYILNSLVKAKLAIGHIRFATRGKWTLNNTHPFTRVINGREWVLAHNGTLNIKKMPEPLLYEPYGETDSERILCLLAGIIHNGGSVEEFEELIQLLSPLGKMNLLFTEGKNLYIYHNGGTLYYRSEKGDYLVATVPFEKNGWKPFPKGRLVIVRNGKEVYRSKLLHDVYTKQTGGVVWKAQTMRS